MFEVEMKFPVADAGDVRARLAALGAKPGAVRTEIDHYFNAPDRDFARTDEALRLRQIDQRNLLTYKGPKLDADTKTRREIETPLADGPVAAGQALALLDALGFRPTATLRKRRLPFGLPWRSFHVEASVDDAEGVGLFAELEIMTPPEQLDAAREAVQHLAAQLGLGQSERRSYLEMWLQKHGQPGHR